MDITYIPYEKINRQKWDRCLVDALHGSLYATTPYLDVIAGKWDALVKGDYEMIMPLVFKRKAGIKYLYQPAFLPQTGIFSSRIVDEETVQAFLEKAFSIFSFAEISLSYPLQTTAFVKNMKVRERDNFIVDLRSLYEDLYKNYLPAFTKSLRRLQKLSLQYSIGEDPKEVTRLFQSLYPEKITGATATDIRKFNAACASMEPGKNIFIRKVYGGDKKLLCAVILLRFNNRLYNMMSCINAEGKKAEANYFLYDKIIEEFAGKGMQLDLEGSDIKGIAVFYRKMNPVNETYNFIRYNNLPPLLRLFKK